MSSHCHTSFNMRLPVRQSFPAEHIQAFGSGRVDRVYLTFASDGTIEKAEAGLIDAPYKRMLIDDPAILCIFGKHADIIDMSAIHPAAKFRLDPLKLLEDENGEVDLASFDVGRLVDITHLPAASRYGWSENYLGKAIPTAEGEVHKRVREALISSNAKQTAWKRASKVRTNNAPLGATSPNLTQRRTVKARTDAGAVKVSDVTHSHVGSNNRKNAENTRTRAVKSPGYMVPSPPASKAPEESGLERRKPALPVRPYTQARKGRRNTPVPNGPQGQNMSLVYRQIIDQLSEDAQITYRNYVTVMRKEAAKDAQTRHQFHNELDTFVHQHNIVDLHNEYATIQKRSGSNKTYQLPTFGTDEIIAS
ncbi:hypothetical protein BDU57DRAFT_566037 [Ampelomyces quisqualis]|uniref:Uncharacterized protein n=1 Tax=Ampelomyces quisqualis TaxID=50730 RepID=A0A6A5Q763_AMPQU|nr:hypothetical protein BDU57DRAFT_566037 [Ampelomyces quisqualis]